jgi:CheY-like chemotaxis protein
LRLRAKGGANSISLELTGSKLSRAPEETDKPAWLSRVNGQVEYAHIEETDGQGFDSWRLTIPVNAEAAKAERPAEAKIRVLAVDNQEVIRELLTGMLSGLGYESSVVATSEAALVLFKATLESGNRYTHVIADYGLDKISGMELAREIRALDPSICFILISSWGLAPDPQDASRIGIDAMLKKPFRMEQLAEIIENSKRGVAR